MNTGKSCMVPVFFFRHLFKLTKLFHSIILWFLSRGVNSDDAALPSNENEIADVQGYSDGYSDRDDEGQVQSRDSDMDEGADADLSEAEPGDSRNKDTGRYVICSVSFIQLTLLYLKNISLKPFLLAL